MEETSTRSESVVEIEGIEEVIKLLVLVGIGDLAHKRKPFRRERWRMEGFFHVFMFFFCVGFVRRVFFFCRQFYIPSFPFAFSFL